MNAAEIPRVCVVGHPIAHSRSPLIHGHWLATLGIAGVYEKKDVLPEAFPGFFAHLRANGYIGANVTVPHKQAAHRLVGRRDPAAEAIGAVNTVWYEGDVLCGGNSDAHGFIANVDETAPGWDVPNVRAVVLGAGGAAHAAAFALASRGVRVAVVNRTEERARDLAMQFGHGITAHGMAEQPPLVIDLGPLRRTAVVCDVVYVPLVTPLLAAAAQRGHRVVDGLGMLLQQAGFGFRKWFGVTPQVTPALRALIEADLLPKPTGS
jgi:shikimate dehydrogenase